MPECQRGPRRLVKGAPAYWSDRPDTITQLFFTLVIGPILPVGGGPLGRLDCHSSVGLWACVRFWLAPSDPVGKRFGSAPYVGPAMKAASTAASKRQRAKGSERGDDPSEAAQSKSAAPPADDWLAEFFDVSESVAASDRAPQAFSSEFHVRRPGLGEIS